MLFFLSKVWGWLKLTGYFCWDNWKVVVPAVLVLILLIWGYLSCGKPVTIDEAEIFKAQKAIAEVDRRVMVEILTNSAVKEADIDGSILAAEEARRKAIEDHSRKTNAELAAELEKRLR